MRVGYFIKESAKWCFLLACVAAILYGVFVEGFSIRIVKAADDGWTRSATNPVAQRKALEQVPVEQQGLTPQEQSEMDEVKIIQRYRVTKTISGLSYYDAKTNMICHVIADANLLHPEGITCTPFVKSKK